MRLPVQTAVWPFLGAGALAVEMGDQRSVAGSYRPPVLVTWPSSPPSLPPQTSMRPPVQIAVCESLPFGALTVEVGVQLSVTGSYRPPVLMSSALVKPPQISMRLLVQRAVCPALAAGALTVEIAVQLSPAG